MINFTLVQKTEKHFTIWIQENFDFGVVRKYEIITNVPGKKYRGGSFDFLNPPNVLQFGHYENLCERLQTFVKENFDLIVNQKSQDRFVYKILNFIS